MGGKVYDMNGLKLNLKENICLVEIDKNVFCQITVVFCTCLYWRDANENLAWCKFVQRKKIGDLVEEFEDLVYREISFERRKSRNVEELWGFVEWSKIVFDGGYYSDSDFYMSSDFFLHSALVTL
ncbi:unnamed protein product [Arabis nemorensis]|uniref:Uncharacterized protein n=1 Tax=Arabis nemorensis TaxID=586526 RepID=A0A565CHH2_9BRAS|nr:unnamed protein product [Arabis nemorensis]